MPERTQTDPLNLTPQRVGRVPFQSPSDDTSDDDSTSAAPDDMSDDDSTSAAPDDTSDDDSTSAAPDDTSDDDSTSAAPPLLSAGETTAGTTLPSFSVPPIVGSKAREQRVSDVTAKVDAGRMQKPGGKRVSWSRTEHLKLMQAVDRTAATGSPSRATSAARPACSATTRSRSRSPRGAWRSRVASESTSHGARPR